MVLSGKNCRRALLAVVLTMVFGMLLISNKSQAPDDNLLRECFLSRGSYRQRSGLPGEVKDSDNCSIYRYHNYTNNKTVGQPLILLNKYKERFDWPPHDYVTITEETDMSSGHVFVTGVSSNHYGEMRAMLFNLQTFAPGIKILFYDLGLKDEYVREVRTLCDVEYRKFDFSAYPDHVSFLKNYAFKPILMAEALREYPRIVWVDSSIRLLSTGNFSHIRSQLMESGGILQMLSNGHSIDYATHPRLYSFFPGNMSKIKTTEMGEAGFLYIARSERMFNSVFLYYVLCALNLDCIQPTTQLKCNPGWFRAWLAGKQCHRFDQSTMSLLLANHYGYNGSIYRDRVAAGGKNTFAAVLRDDEEAGKLRTCR